MIDERALTAEQEAEDRARAVRYREAFAALCTLDRDFLRYYDETQSLRSRLAAVEQERDALAIARVVVAARLAELADKEGDLMFDDFKSNDNCYETGTVWIGAKALLTLLFPETP